MNIIASMWIGAVIGTLLTVLVMTKLWPVLIPLGIIGSLALVILSIAYLSDWE